MWKSVCMNRSRNRFEMRTPLNASSTLCTSKGKVVVISQRSLRTGSYFKKLDLNFIGRTCISAFEHCFSFWLSFVLYLPYWKTLNHSTSKWLYISPNHLSKLKSANAEFVDYSRYSCGIRFRFFFCLWRSFCSWKRKRTKTLKPARRVERVETKQIFS